MVNVLWFKDIKKEGVAEAGKKGAVLADLYNSGFPVAHGFVVPASFYSRFVRETGIFNKISNLISVIDVNDPDRLQTLVNQIQKLIVTTELIPEIKEALIEAYHSIESEDDMIKVTEPYVGVRNSVTLEQEDVKGLHAAYFNVKGADRLTKAVKAVWASLFTARAVTYRENKNLGHEHPMAVIVQIMVDIKRSGLLSVQGSDIIVRAGLGLMNEETVMDKYIISKEGLNLLDLTVSTQPVRYVLDFDSEKMLKEDIGDTGKKQKLNDKEAQEVARMGKKLGKHYGTPHEAEWAMTNDKFYFLHVRQIKAIASEKTEERKEDEVDLEDNEDKHMFHENHFKEGSDEGEYHKEEASTDEKGTIPIQQTPNCDIEDPKEIFAKSKFSSNNIIVGCDMAIRNTLRLKYNELFGEDTENSFNDIIDDIKSRIRVPYADDILRVHEIRDNFLNKSKDVSAEELKFALETTEKFINEF